MSLLGKAPLQGIFRRLLLVVDGSAAGLRAAKYAIILAKHAEAALWAQAVVDTATIRELELSRIFVEEEASEYERELEEDAKKHLNHIVSLAEAKKVRAEPVLARGSVYARIVEFAMEKDVDLVIIGGSSRSVRAHERDRASLEYARVLRESRVSVLFVKDEKIDLEYKKL